MGAHAGRDLSYAVMVSTDSDPDRARRMLELAELRRRAADLESELGLRGGWARPEGEAPFDVGAYQLLAQHASDFLSIHAANGDYLFASSSVERLFGYAPDDLIGRSAYELFHPEDLQRITEDHQKHVEGRDGAVRYRLRRADGSYRSVETRSQAHRSTEGLEQIVCITRDVEDAVQLEAMLRDQRDALEQRLDELRRELLRAERLASVGTMAGAIGHELRNIAVAITPNVQVLAEQIERGEAPDREVLDDLLQAGQHLEMHATSLLGLVRLPPNAEPTSDVGEVVRRVVRMVRLAGRLKHVDVDVDAEQHGLRARITAVHLEQILLNLINNAADAVETSASRRIRLRTVRESIGIRIEIADTGCGIAPAGLERIFDPYFTTKSPDRGTGLGLLVVRRLVEEARGRLDVESRIGVGSTFRIDLPSEAAVARPPDPHP